MNENHYLWGKQKSVVIWFSENQPPPTRELFGGISYSAVVRVFQRFSKQLEEVRKKITKIDRKMFYVKGHIVVP